MIILFLPPPISLLSLSCPTQHCISLLIKVNLCCSNILSILGSTSLLEHGWPTRDYTVTENWPVLSKQLTFANSSCFRRKTSCSIPLSRADMLQFLIHCTLANSSEITIRYRLLVVYVKVLHILVKPPYFVIIFFNQAVKVWVFAEIMFTQ